MKRAILILIATILAAAVPAARAAAADVIYTTTDNGTALATIDPATGAGTVIGPFGYGNTFGLAVDTDGTLWTIVNDTSAATIARVNKATGQATPAPSPIGTQMYALDIAGDGTMYGISISDDRLYRIDKTTGVGTPIGSGTGLSSTMDIAFDCDGNLWATAMGDLYEIDTTTGAGTMQTSLNGFAGATNVMGLMVDSSCHMLATTYASPGQLYSIDTATGAGTAVGSTGLNAPHGGSIETFTRDTTAPATTDDVPVTWRNTPATVTLSSSDGSGTGVAHIYCTIGADPPAPTTSSTVYDPAHKPTLANGERIRYFAVDQRGNAETEHASPAARVDTVAPATSDDVPAAVQAGPVAVTLNGSDDLSGVAAIHYEVGTDPAAPTASSPVYDPGHKPVLTDGQRISYFAVDNAGNAEAAHTSRAVQVATAALPPITSSRWLTIHLRRRYGGHAVRAVSATVDGRRAKVARTRGGYRLLVDMRGHACTPVKVRIAVALRGAKTVTIRRTYLTCTPGR
jgi:hypothetical protein